MSQVLIVCPTLIPVQRNQCITVLSSVEMGVTFHVHREHNRLCLYKRNIKRAFTELSLPARAMRIKYYDSLSVNFVIQHAMRMRHIVICTDVQYFFPIIS
jgi:hypothetical protein